MVRTPPPSLSPHFLICIFAALNPTYTTPSPSPPHPPPSPDSDQQHPGAAGRPPPLPPPPTNAIQMQMQTPFLGPILNRFCSPSTRAPGDSSVRTRARWSSTTACRRTTRTSRWTSAELTTRASMLDSNISFSGVSSAGRRGRGRRHGRAQLGEVADEAEAARMLVALLALFRLSPASTLDTSTYLRIAGGSASMGEAGAFGCLVELFVGCGSLEDEGFWMNPGLRDAMPCLRRVGARVSQWVAPGIGGGVFDFSLPPPPPPPSPSPPRFSEAATASSVGGGKPADSALRSTGPSGAQCQWGVARVLECLPSGLECFVVFPNPLIEIEPFLVPAGHSPRPGSYSLHPPLTPASAQNQISDIISGYSYPKVVFGVSKKQYEGVVDPELLEQLGDPEEIVSSICVDGVGCSWQYKGTAAGDSLREMRDEMWRQAKNIIKRRVTKNTKGVCL